MHKEISSQYRASLKMLMEAIDRCPQDTWTAEGYDNAYWRIVYHALFYTAFYLSENPASFVPYSHHFANYNFLGKLTHEHKPIDIERIYLKDEMMEYAQSISDGCEASVGRIPMDSESGFDWIPMNRFELHLYNLRHIQHHAGQLIERLHTLGIHGIKWEGKA